MERFQHGDSEAELQRLRAENAELQHRVSHDQFTGLLNKQALRERLAEKVEQDVEFGILFIDISKLKEVNDKLGHALGDELILGTANILKNCVRHQEEPQQTDLIAHERFYQRPPTHSASRYGGDEFILLSDLQPRTAIGENLTPEERLKAIQERIRSNFISFIDDQPVSDKLRALGLDIAIGGAVWNPEEPVSPKELLGQADTAMYKDKYTNRDTLTPAEIARLKAVEPILRKVGVRVDFLPEPQ